MGLLELNREQFFKTYIYEGIPEYVLEIVKRTWLKKGKFNWYLHPNEPLKELLMSCLRIWVRAVKNGAYFVYMN